MAAATSRHTDWVETPMTTMKALTRRSLMDKAVKGAGLAIAAIIGRRPIR